MGKERAVLPRRAGRGSKTPVGVGTEMLGEGAGLGEGRDVAGYGPLSFTSRATREVKKGFEVLLGTHQASSLRRNLVWGGSPKPPLLSPNRAGTFWLNYDASATTFC